MNALPIHLIENCFAVKKKKKNVYNEDLANLVQTFFWCANEN